MKSMKSVPAAALIIILSAFFGAVPAGALETVRFFCSNCVDLQSARIQATQYAAPLICNTDGAGPVLDPEAPLECSAADRRVILGNHIMRDVFGFRVARGDEFPWEITATPIELTADEQLGYTAVLDLRNDWEQIVSQGMLMSPSSPEVVGDSPVCIEGTALDWVIVPDQLSALKTMITIQLSGNLDDYLDQSPWYIPEVGVGARVRGLEFNFRWPGGGEEQGVPVFAVEWTVAPNGLRDVLVFDIELAGLLSDGQAITNLQLNEGLSRVEGVQLNDLLSGNVTITDECVLEKLARLDDGPSGEFRVGGLPLNSDGSVGSGGSGSGGPGGGSPSNMCVYDFFVNGRYQYSFRAPCDAFETNDEIQP